jgi:CheY-like chemotaxis protein
LYLPAEENSLSVKKNEKSKEHKGNGTFLIMDDEEVLRNMVGDMLESFGYSVVKKNNGTDAIAFFKSEIDAGRKLSGMIFDLTIPGNMGGKEAIHEVRKLCHVTPVFVASGYADDPVVATPSSFGFTASICKPFKSTELADLLNKYLG